MPQFPGVHLSVCPYSSLYSKSYIGMTIIVQVLQAKHDDQDDRKLHSVSDKNQSWLYSCKTAFQGFKRKTPRQRRMPNRASKSSPSVIKWEQVVLNQDQAHANRFLYLLRHVNLVIQINTIVTYFVACLQRNINKISSE